jgi:large subunit ribosomal protein L22
VDQQGEAPVVPDTVYRASHKRARGSAKKLRLVIDMIRGKKVPQARDVLRFTPKRAAYYIDRVLQSAIANAENTGQVDVDDLVIHRAWVDEGPTRMGRWKFAAHGRVRPIMKRSSHIHVELCAAPEEDEAPAGRSGRKSKE